MRGLVIGFATVMGVQSQMVAAQQACGPISQCAQAAVEAAQAAQLSAERARAAAEATNKRIDDLEKGVGRIETGTLVIPPGGGHRAEFSSPFKNPPKVFMSVTGMRAYDLHATDGTHFYFAVAIDKIDNNGINFTPPDYSGSKIDSITLSWIAIGQ
jgi:hypothetical protein